MENDKIEQKKFVKKNNWIVFVFILLIFFYPFFYFTSIYKQNSNIIQNGVSLTGEVIGIQEQNERWGGKDYFYYSPMVKYECGNQTLTQIDKNIYSQNNDYHTGDVIKLYCLSSSPQDFVVDNGVFQKNILEAFFSYFAQNHHFYPQKGVYIIIGLFVLYILSSLFLPQLFQKKETL